MPVRIGRYWFVSVLIEGITHWDIGFRIVSVCIHGRYFQNINRNGQNGCYDRNLKKKKKNSDEKKKRAGMHAIQRKRKKKINIIIHSFRENNQKNRNKK